MTNNLGSLSPFEVAPEEPPEVTGMHNETDISTQPPEQLKRVTELRNRILALTGSGHGPELQKIMDELGRLQPQQEAVPPTQQKENLEETAMRKFLRRPDK